MTTSITNILPATFGIIFDGWSCAGEHYIGIYATWVNISGGVMQVLLSCGVQDLPTDADSISDIGFTAEDIGDYLYDVLKKYNRGFEAIEFIVGDNASVNRLLANRIKEWLQKNKNISRTLPLIGCASHKLNLAVQSLYSPGTPEHEVVEKVHKLMIELGTLKNRM